jgi:hypothetical protein
VGRRGLRLRARCVRVRLTSYGYGYGNGPAYGTSYYSSYPPYHYGCCRPYYGEAYAVPQATRRGVIHRSRWRAQ